jgi:hypothetical protein
MVSRAIQIAERGSFSGKVDVDVAEVRGTFQGELTARKKLVIHASGRVAGKIRYGKMLVQEGGEMSGDVAGAHRRRSSRAAAELQSSRARRARGPRRCRGEGQEPGPRVSGTAACARSVQVLARDAALAAGELLQLLVGARHACARITVCTASASTSHAPRGRRRCAPGWPRACRGRAAHES